MAVPGQQAVSVAVASRAGHRRSRFSRSISILLLVGKIATANSPGKTALSEKTGTNSGTLPAGPPPIDVQLNELVEAWPTMPDDVKAGIMAMVKAAGDGGRAD